MGMMWAIAIFGLVCYIINTIVVGKLLRYGLPRQFWDWLPCLLVTAAAAALAWASGRVLHINEYVLMIIQVLLFSFVYIIISYLFKLEAFTIYSEIVKTKWQHFRNRSNH